KRLGFSYKQTSKVPVPLDAPSFVSQRAAYFRRIDDLRASGAHIYWHDETWVNVGEEKRSIWLDEANVGRIRKGDGKGKRLAISAMINEEGFHKDSVDIFTCAVDHNMNSKHFLEWISRSASQLRQKHSKDERIALIIDNATWHNVLTVESSPPKRAWPKAKLHQWLKDHDIPFDQRMKNSELRDIAFSHVPRKEYLTNIAASEFDVEIIRLPIKHCCFNPIELCWAQLKGHVRRHNTSFRLSDIQRLSNEYIDSLSDCSQYIEHAKKAEDVFKLGDNFVEETIDPELVDEDEEEEDPFWINSNDEEDS
ncbi:unnamed protein product, partial [Didymodactylos carnosus]